MYKNNEGEILRRSNLTEPRMKDGTINALAHGTFNHNIQCKNVISPAQILALKLLFVKVHMCTTCDNPTVLNYFDSTGFSFSYFSILKHT